MPEISSSNDTPWKFPENVEKTIILSLSSEYRTPLSTILGYSELLLARKAGLLNEQQAEMTTHIHSAAS